MVVVFLHFDGAQGRRVWIRASGSVRPDGSTRAGGHARTRTSGQTPSSASRRWPCRQPDETRRATGTPRGSRHGRAGVATARPRVRARAARRGDERRAPPDRSALAGPRRASGFRARLRADSSLPVALAEMRDGLHRIVSEVRRGPGLDRGRLRRSRGRRARPVDAHGRAGRGTDARLRQHVAPDGDREPGRRRRERGEHAGGLRRGDRPPGRSSGRRDRRDDERDPRVGGPHIESMAVASAARADQLSRIVEAVGRTDDGPRRNACALEQAAAGDRQEQARRPSEPVASFTLAGASPNREAGRRDDGRPEARRTAPPRLGPPVASARGGQGQSE